MKIDGRYYRSVWLSENGWSVHIFDQRALPWELKIIEINSADMAAQAIKEMWTRGAPLIGAVAAYGLCMALREDPTNKSFQKNYEMLLATRPTAVNLRWALDRIKTAAAPQSGETRVRAAYDCAKDICDEDVVTNKAIGTHGLEIIRALAKKNPGRPINILTHCNAGWLATVDYGTALAPIYMAHDEGMPVHVWVDETRPRNQGALLTAYELSQHGVPHTVITDNAGGLLMQRRQVDFCIVGCDRVSKNGDVCNKVGTYLKALAAYDNKVPFYVALPSTTFDETVASGADIPIEDRNADEVTMVYGKTAAGTLETVQLTASSALNPAFDVTPARLVSAYITEHGVFETVENAFFQGNRLIVLKETA